MTTTQQVEGVPNPTGKGGFGDNPQNRNPGGWDKTQSISYQYNRLMRMEPDELDEFVPETVAQKVAKQRITEMMEDNNETKGGALQVTKEVTDRVEGKAPQTVDISNPDGSLNPYNSLTTEELRKLAGK